MIWKGELDDDLGSEMTGETGASEDTAEGDAYADADAACDTNAHTNAHTNAADVLLIPMPMMLLIAVDEADEVNDIDYNVSVDDVDELLKIKRRKIPMPKY